MKRGIIFAFVFIIILTQYFKFTRSNSSNTFVVGTAAGYAPFVSINAQGEYEGFDVDIARTLATSIEKKLVLKDLGSMTSLMMALENGSIDAIIWGLSITADRLKKLAMIHYQGDAVTAYPLIFWQKIPNQIRSINDMNNHTVCVEPSSSQYAVLSKYKNITILPTEKVDDALLNIRYGKADAALVEPAIAKKFKNKFCQIQILDVPLSRDDQVQGIGIAVKKDKTHLIKQITNTVDELKQNGTIKELVEKWAIE